MTDEAAVGLIDDNVDDQIHHAAVERQPLGLVGNLGVILMILLTLYAGYLINRHQDANHVRSAVVETAAIPAAVPVASNNTAIVVQRHPKSWDNSPYWLFTLALMTSIVGGFFHRAIGAVFGSITGFLIGWALIGPWGALIIGAIGYWAGMFATDVFVYLLHGCWTDRNCDLID